MFQGGGACVEYVDGAYEFYEVPLYGDNLMWHRTYKRSDIDVMLDEAYSWT